MPSARRSHTIAAPPEELWLLIGDPHHMPRWWPRVERVEDVAGDAFTHVMRTAKGKVVRADYRVRRVDESERTLVWEQQLEETPFARVLSSSEIHVRLAPAEEGTNVTIELHQRLSGFAPRFGSFMVRRAAAKTVADALDGLERIVG